MITINLLPEESRAPVTVSLQQFSHSPLAMMLAGGLAGVTLLFVGARAVQHARLTRVTAQIQQCLPHKTTVEQLRDAVAALRARHAIYERLDHGRSQWARLLNVLSDVMPDGVWLTELSLDAPQAVLTLEGSAIGEGEEKVNRIGRLVQALKVDPVFSAAARDIQI
ncbi:MAG: PilN domain-containing protein, partial [Candidatus Omnitrophica bacterium]|nr:PilN domain-containing protein [Candidatus Omnitrophota bacterium]